MTLYKPVSVEEIKSWASYRIKQKQNFRICGKGNRYISEVSGKGILNCKDILSLRKLKSIRFFDPEDMVVGIESGMSIQTLQKVLAQRNMVLPINSWYPDSCIGSVVACNDFGANRMNMGGIRDYIIGIEYINGKGEIVKAGGKVVKNVSGYDITRMMLGSLGGLGIITSINFKVLPQPIEPHGMFGVFKDGTWLIKVKEIHKRRIPLDWIEAVSTSDFKWILGLGYSGNTLYRKRIEDEISKVFGNTMQILPEKESFNGQKFTPGEKRFGGFVKYFRDSWEMDKSCFHIFGTFSTEMMLGFPIDYFCKENFKILIHPIGADIHLMHESKQKNEQLQLLDKIKSFLSNSNGKLRWVSGASQCMLNELGNFGVANGYSLTKRLKRHLDPASVFSSPYYEMEFEE